MSARLSYENLSVSVKILTAVVTAVAVAIIVGIVGLVKLRESSMSAQLIYTSNVSSIKEVAMVKAAVYQSRLAAANQAIAQSDAEEQSFTQAFATHVQEFKDAIATYRSSGPAGETALIDELETSFDSYDAGKGFAVVASEVKDLAQETARATEDISRRVQAIQADTIGAVTAIEEITSVISRISDYQTTIASAVEEQTATTAEMNRSVSEASSGTNEIAQNITMVAQAAATTSRGVAETQQATGELARMSSDLNALVAGFRY